MVKILARIPLSWARTIRLGDIWVDFAPSLGEGCPSWVYLGRDTQDHGEALIRIVYCAVQANRFNARGTVVFGYITALIWGPWNASPLIMCLMSKGLCAMVSEYYLRMCKAHLVEEVALGHITKQEAALQWFTYSQEAALLFACWQMRLRAECANGKFLYPPLRALEMPRAFGPNGVLGLVTPGPLRDS